MTNLPDDLLITNIFIRLPAKQLAQMRSLSKPWNAFLSHPDFIKSHLDRSISNKVEILMVFYSLFSFRDRQFTAHPSKSPHLEVSNIFKLPPNTSSQHILSHVVGSVNGLICFSNRPYPTPLINIWNPSLSTLILLPPYSIPERSHTLRFRFGFDPKSDDYKVVKLVCCFGAPRFSDDRGLFVPKEWQQVEVYSMKKGSWQIITHTFPSHVTMIYNEDQVCVDGHDGRLHWIGHMYDEMKLQTIVTFDLCLETFSQICLPDSIQEVNKSCSIILGFMEGKLCVMSHVINDECEIWVMDEYGVAESWVKRYVLSHLNGIVNPFGFTSNGEFLCETDDGLLALYDPVLDKVKSFEVKANPVLIGTTKIVQYVESLVWVAPTSLRCNTEKGLVGSGMFKTGYK